MSCPRQNLAGRRNGDRTAYGVFEHSLRGSLPPLNCGWKEKNGEREKERRETQESGRERQRKFPNPPPVCGGLSLPISESPAEHSTFYLIFVFHSWGFLFSSICLSRVSVCCSPAPTSRLPGWLQSIRFLFLFFLIKTNASELRYSHAWRCCLAGIIYMATRKFMNEIENVV